MSYEPTVWVDGDHVTSAKLNKLEQGVNSMSYTPTVWNAGDVVTAEKLNKLEQGVAEGGGGGGGDFTTAQVTFVNNTGRLAQIPLGLPMIDTVEQETYIISGALVQLVANASISKTAVLYNGKSAYVDVGSWELNITAEGDVILDEEDGTVYGFTVTGNCTITVTASE